MIKNIFDKVVNTFETPNLKKFSLSKDLITKLAKFQEAFENLHETIIFQKNSFYCSYYKTNLLYSEFEKKWYTENGTSFQENYRKTNHICCVKPIIDEVNKFKIPEKGRMLGEPISMSLLFLLEIIQSSVVATWIAHNNFLRRGSNEEDEFVKRLINGNGNAELILDRILSFYDNFVNLETNPKVIRKIPIISNKDYLISELPALPSVPFAKKKNQDGGYNITDDDQYKTIWHYPWQLIIPPIDWTKKIRSLSFPEMSKWNLYRSITLKDDYFKTNTVFSASYIKDKYFPLLEMDIEFLEGIIDKRIEKNETVTISILYKFF